VLYTLGDDRRRRIGRAVVDKDELNAGRSVLCQAHQILRGISLDVEERDDDRQPDHLFPP